MSLYDNYVWRLHSEAPQEVYDVVLPKDLEWTDEFTWNPVFHDMKNTLSGAIVIQEYKQLTGQPITLEGKDDMAWIKRPTVEKLVAMRNEPGLVMKLKFLSASHDPELDTWTFGTVHIVKNVMFKHSDVPLDFESVKRFENFEPTSWFKIKSIKLVDIGNGNPLNPCI